MAVNVAELEQAVIGRRIVSPEREDRWYAQEAAFVLTLAQRIAAKPAFALKLTKEAVNRSVDVMGQPAAIEQAFALHQLCHAHNLQEFGMVVDPSGLHTSVRKPTTAKL